MIQMISLFFSSERLFEVSFFLSWSILPSQTANIVCCFSTHFLMTDDYLEFWLCRLSMQSFSFRSISIENLTGLNSCCSLWWNRSGRSLLVLAMMKQGAPLVTNYFDSYFNFLTAVQDSCSKITQQPIRLNSSQQFTVSLDLLRRSLSYSLASSEMLSASRVAKEAAIHILYLSSTCWAQSRPKAAFSGLQVLFLVQQADIWRMQMGSMTISLM